MSEHQDGTTDALVVGGGPAGSAASLRLARAGFQVIQLERRVFGDPRNDALRSGEALIPRTQRELAALGVNVQEAEWRLDPVTRVAFHWPNGAVCETRLAESSQLVHVQRDRFDGALFAAARHAGVDGREGWRVRDFLLERGRVAGVLACPPGGTISQPIGARLVIDTGGRNALALRRFDLRTPLPGTNFFALAMFFDDVAGLHDGTWEMHMFDAEQLTVVQLSRLRPGMVRCGLGIAQQAQQAAACDPQQFFWRRIAAAPELAARLRHSRVVSRPFARASLSYGVRSAVLDGLLLAGDATGYLNPLFGDGILRALRDGRAAADSAARALAMGDSHAAFKAYARRHAVRLAYDRVLAQAIKFGYAAPSVLGAFSRLAPAQAAMLAALTR